VAAGGYERVGSLDVTASVLGRQAYSRFDVEDLVGSILSPMRGAVYRSRSEGVSGSPRRFRTCDRRQESDRTALAPGGAATATGGRTGARAGRAHSTRRSLAAMAMLAELDTAAVVLDPFSGSGTIAIETTLLMQGSGPRCASDIDAEGRPGDVAKRDRGARGSACKPSAPTTARALGRVRSTASLQPQGPSWSCSPPDRYRGSFNDLLAGGLSHCLVSSTGSVKAS